jgi:amidase
VNCLTENFVERALSRAAELDEALKKTGKVVGPLHGLPISLKDQLCMKGLRLLDRKLCGKERSTCRHLGRLRGCSFRKDERTANTDGKFAQFLGLPRSPLFGHELQWLETFNNIFGRTANPYNRSLTSGGSSGGEGALIALKGSPLGVGSDIGG